MMRTRASSSANENGDQIVVGPKLQPLDAIFHLVACGQEQHWHLQAALAQRLQHLPAVQPGQHDIQDHEVVGTVQGHVQPIGAMGHQVRDIPGSLKPWRKYSPVLGSSSTINIFTGSAPLRFWRKCAPCKPADMKLTKM
jgi:hypothetical protein